MIIGGISLLDRPMEQKRGSAPEWVVNAVTSLAMKCGQHALGLNVCHPLLLALRNSLQML